MHKKLTITFFIGLSIFNLNFAEEIVWSGEVSSDGTPSKAINLNLDKKYQIIVSGTINLGKWVQAGKPLGEDASYDFNAPTGPRRVEIFKNSNDIALDDQSFNPNHIYKSEPFVAKQNKIHFWVHDEDYSDKVGNFDVKIVQLD
jgi:hypothetical protein